MPKETKKSAFMIALTGVIISAVIDATDRPTAFELGKVYTLLSDLLLNPMGILPAGTQLYVDEHQFDTGIVVLRPLQEHAVLRTWGQELCLHPFQSDDVLAALNATGRNGFSVQLLQVA